MMQRLLPVLFLLSGLFFLTVIQPSAAPAPPPQVNCGKHGGLVYKLANGAGQICVDSALFTPVPVQPPGTTCTAPPAGSAPMVYAQATDGSCLPLIAVPAPDSIVAGITTEYGEVAVDGQPVLTHYTFEFVRETAAPGSNLCPAPDGVEFQTCGPEQTPP